MYYSYDIAHRSDSITMARICALRNGIKGVQTKSMIRGMSTPQVQAIPKYNLLSTHEAEKGSCFGRESTNLNRPLNSLRRKWFSGIIHITYPRHNSSALHPSNKRPLPSMIGYPVGKDRILTVVRSMTPVLSANSSTNFHLTNIEPKTEVSSKPR